MAARAVSRTVGQEVARQARPVVSSSAAEARRAVLATYRHWMKQSGRIWYEQTLQSFRLSVFRQAVKDRFLANAHVKDIRVIDRLVGESELMMREADNHALNHEHMKNRLLKDHVRPKPADFLSKFFAGKN